MRPAADPSVLSSGPQFEALYRDICTNKLNPDGTSKLDVKAQKEHDTLNELQEVVAIVAAVLEGHVTEEDRLLLEDDLAKFDTNLSLVTAALSNFFQNDVATLLPLLSIEKPPITSELPAHITNFQASIGAARFSTAEVRSSIAAEAASLHQVYAKIIETSIRILEQTIHGSVARGSKARSDYLAVMAEGMSKKLELQRGQLFAQLYSEDVQEALQGKVRKMDEEAVAMRRKIREAEGKLEEYEGAQGAVGLAREYAEILREVERVKGEMKRLGRG